MISMIKKVLIISFVVMTSSCTSIDLGYVDLVRDRFKKNLINDQDAFNSTKYSFIRATKGGNQAIFILSNYDKGIETWVGAGQETIVTYKGFILSTTKLEKNIKYHNLIKPLSSIASEKFSSFLSLKDPRADYLMADFQILNDEVSPNFDQKCNGELNAYSRSINALRYKDLIYVCTFLERTKFSLQKPHPHDKEIFIEFFYR